MKKIAVKVITISSLVLVVSLFMTILFSSNKAENNMAFVVENNNLCKMDNNTSIRFNESLKKLEDINTNESVVEELVDTSVKEEEKQDVKEEIKEEVQEVHNEEIKDVKEGEPSVTTSDEVVNNVTPLTEEREVLQTVIGNLTGYGPDCVGCGGKTSTGFDLNASIYYEDSEFGTVRILAADPSFPFYSIIRVSNVPTMDDFIGIVLDRGGNVGFGRGTLFDLAFESESSPNLVPLTRNVTFELLRSGR